MGSGCLSHSVNEESYSVEVAEVVPVLFDPLVTYR